VGAGQTCIRTNPNGLHLTRVQISDVNLTGSTFIGSKLIATDIFGVNFTWANLSNAFIDGANANADLRQASLEFALTFTRSSGRTRCAPAAV
jgi:uncharacterized protein YjbI with pentapeptide repeats